jgi:hypothetical protein
LAVGHAEDRLRVYLDRVIQPDYLGVNAVYHGFAFMPEQVSRGMDDAARAREFARVSEMRLHIARTWYRPDWACGESFTTPCDWESPRMRAFYSWLAEMRGRNVDVALQAGWWFTRDTYLGAPAPDPARDTPHFAQWVSESLHQIVELRGFHNVKYLILFTEPSSNSGAIPAGETQWSYYAATVRAIDARLRADGRRTLVKLVGPNNSSGGLRLSEAAAQLNDAIDIYSGHAYNQRTYDDWLAMCRKMAEAVASTRKPLWLDELGRQDEPYRQTGDYGTYLAQIVAASLNAGLQTSLQWLLFDQQYVAPLQNADGKDSFHGGVHAWGACRWPPDDAPCRPQWDAVRLLSRCLGGGSGTQVFATEGSEALKVAATSPAGSGLTVLVVNTSEAPRKFSLQLRGKHRKQPLYRYLYDPAGTVSVAGRARLRGSVPARGFVAYSTVRP